MDHLNWLFHSIRRPQASGYEPLFTAGGASYHWARRRFCIIIALIVLTTLLALSASSLYYEYDAIEVLRSAVPQAWAEKMLGKGKQINRLAPLLGPPTLSFRDNLRNDTLYITAFTTAGWTNQVMSYINMLYIALITSRIPIIPGFAGGHVPWSTGGGIDFGIIFDVERLSEGMGIPVLEWKEVKNYTSEDAVVDDCGCWSVWAMSFGRPGHSSDPAPVPNHLERPMKLDVAYTSIPEYTIMETGIPNDVYTSFWSLAQLGFPMQRMRALNTHSRLYPSPMHNHSLPPDEHMLCYDFLYYVAALYRDEYNYDFSPAWRFVGQYMHWTSQVTNLGSEYLRQTFGVDPYDPVPPYIAMHVRHGDFGNVCKGEKKAISDCFASLDVFSRRIEEIRAALQISPNFNFTQQDVDTLPVLVMSDEKSPEFWKDVEGMGWKTVNHTEMQTVEKYGLWYPPILDAYFQSSGVGFVGTHGSTMSLLAHKRVVDWRGGEGRDVRWGKPGADDH